MKRHEIDFKSFNFTEKGNCYAITTRKQNRIEVYDLQTNKLVKTVKNKGDHKPYFSSDGAYFAKLTNFTVNIWNVELNLCVKLLHFTSNIWNVCFSSCNNFFAVSTFGNEIQVFDVTNMTGEFLSNNKSLKGKKKPIRKWKLNTIVNQLLFYDTNTLITAFKTVQIWNWREKNVIFEISLDAGVSSMSLNQDLLLLNDNYVLDMKSHCLEKLNIPIHHKKLVVIGKTLFSFCIDDAKVATLYDIRKQLIVYKHKLYPQCSEVWNINLIDICSNYFATRCTLGVEIFRFINFKTMKNVVYLLRNTATYVVMDIANMVEANEKKKSFEMESNSFMARKIAFIDRLKIIKNG